jgi:hypothetical protein
MRNGTTEESWQPYTIDESHHNVFAAQDRFDPDIGDKKFVVLPVPTGPFYAVLVYPA